MGQFGERERELVKGQRKLNSNVQYIDSPDYKSLKKISQKLSQYIRGNSWLAVIGERGGRRGWSGLKDRRSASA